MHLVKDALTLDRQLIPLWRKIAAAADEQLASGAAESTDNPWRRGASGAGAAPSGVAPEEATGNPWRR